MHTTSPCVCDVEEVRGSSTTGPGDRGERTGPRSGRPGGCRIYAETLGLPVVEGWTDEAYETTVARLRRHGLPIEEHRFSAYQDSRAAYVTDLDGHVVEFWTWDVANHLQRPPMAMR